MEKKLKELFNVIMEEMKTNDEFKNKIVNIINGKYSTVEEAYRYVKERSVQKIGEKLKSIYLKLEDA